MVSDVEGKPEERLILRGNLGEIARVHPWIEHLASQYEMPEDVQFKSNLCLEEVLSNIVLHGYKDKQDGAVIVRFEKPCNGRFLFTVEDEAPWFNPLEHPELEALQPQDEIRIGGQGLRLLRAFADTLEYEQLPNGNRIKIFLGKVAFGPQAGKTQDSALSGIPPRKC